MVPDFDDPPLSYIVGHHLLLVILFLGSPRAVESISPRIGAVSF